MQVQVCKVGQFFHFTCIAKAMKQVGVKNQHSFIKVFNLWLHTFWKLKVKVRYKVPQLNDNQIGRTRVPSILGPKTQKMD